MPKLERMFRKKITLPFAETEQEKTENFILEGEIQALFVRSPDFAAAQTAVVSILDEDGFEMVVSTALAHNTDHRVAAAWPLAGVQTMKVRLSAVLGAGDAGDVVVVAYGRQVG